MNLGRLFTATGIYTLGLVALWVMFGLAFWLGSGPVPYVLIAITCGLGSAWWVGRELK